MQHGTDILGKTTHGFFVDDPIVAENAEWGKAVKDEITPSVGGNGDWNYYVPYSDAGVGGVFLERPLGIQYWMA
ncbi:hypothetical protein [Burkholderia contaminans]|uniref:hypothetical protein n=1 Tax=Burkholderia contaminans TaxID=488447 RepID=UPI000F5AEA31|nr:hypothetical protein [Burkholderia contaminans]